MYMTRQYVEGHTTPFSVRNLELRNHGQLAQLCLVPALKHSKAACSFIMEVTFYVEAVGCNGKDSSFAVRLWFNLAQPLTICVYVNKLINLYSLDFLNP